MSGRERAGGPVSVGRTWLLWERNERGRILGYVSEVLAWSSIMQLLVNIVHGKFVVMWQIE